MSKKTRISDLSSEREQVKRKAPESAERKVKVKKISSIVANIYGTKDDLSFLDDLEWLNRDSYTFTTDIDTIMNSYAMDPELTISLAKNDSLKYSVWDMPSMTPLDAEYKRAARAEFARPKGRIMKEKCRGRNCGSYEFVCTLYQVSRGDEASISKRECVICGLCEDY